MLLKIVFRHVLVMNMVRVAKDTLVLFIQSPMALIFGNRYANNFGLLIAVVVVCVGICLHQIAKKKYPYVIEKERNLQ